MEQVEVSVIVPVFNTAPFVRACLDSLLNQTFSSFEIVVVNDGSTDNSKDILYEYATKYPKKIKCFDKTNGGLSSARNFGLNKACGKYVSFVDSDDTVEPSFLERMMDAAQKNNSEIVVCTLNKVNSEGKLLRKLHQMNEKKGDEEVIEVQNNFKFFGEFSWFACNKIYKKELFDKFNFVENMHYEDIATIPIILLQAKKIVVIENGLYNYYERSNSITKKYDERGLDMLEAIRLVKSYLLSNNSNVFQTKAWKNFVILQGFYSFLAYFAFVKEPLIKRNMREELFKLIHENDITLFNVLSYQRFNSNYLLSLPLKKMLYYFWWILFNWPLMSK